MNKKIVLIAIIVLTLIIPMTCLITNNLKNNTETKLLDYKERTGNTIYHDWSEIDTNNLTAGAISSEYSYSTIFYNDNTEFKIIKSAGTITWKENAAGIKIPQVTGLTEQDELILLVTNCAVNKDGKMLDVVIKINNIDIWESGSVYFYTHNQILFLNSQKNPNSGGDYSVVPNTGDPISFELGSTTASCDFTMTYYVSGTYNSTTDSGTLGNVNHINGFYYDIDVPGNDEYSDKILGGREGITPIVGKSTIYYNKNRVQPDNVDTFETYLKEIDNGIAIDTVKGNTNAIWYADGMFMMTEDINDSTLKFQYGGQGCGIYYIFATPYPYELNAPTKSVTANEITRNQTITYQINQFIPNNYYGSIMNFSEMFPNLRNSTRFNLLKITDTIDSNLVINGNITVTNMQNEDVTSYFDITTSGNTITATGKSDYFGKLLFYNNKYTINIPVSLKSGTISKKTISNKATTQSKIGTNATTDTYDSNSVNVNVYYYVTVKHLIEGTNQALATEQKIKKYHGDSYTTSMLTNIPSDYEYSSKTSNYTGTATDNITVTYYYKLKKGILTVNHLEEGTNKVLSTQEVSTLNYTTTYKTSPSATAQKTHVLVETPSNATGKINGNIIVNYYYKKKDSTLIVKYLEDGTNKQLASPKTQTVHYTDTYTTSESSEVPNNYELKRKTDNYTGVVSSSNIEVIYYYQKKDSTLETSITKTGPEEITSSSESINYEITYTAKVTDYIGNGTITIVDTLPYHINIEKSELEEGIYDEDTNTITWTIPWNEIDSFSNQGETTIIKKISVVYSDLIATERIMINSVKGSIELDNNSRETESQTSTNIKIPGNITIHYYVKDTEIPLKDSIVATDLVGETYTSSAEELEGYILTKPELETFTFKEEPQTVIYYYEKIKVHIKTEVNGEGGTITGEEDIEYGNDSTKDKIVIKPDDGYVLGEVIINGEKLELTEKDKYGLVLDNFHEMKEDINIVVKFEKVEENPNTEAFISIIIILTIPISLVVLTYLKKQKKILKI